MNPIDYSILHFFNQFVNRSRGFDSTIDFIAGNNLLKGGVVMMVFWWLWFRRPEGSDESAKWRQILLASLLMTLAAVVAARVLAASLPYRERPIRNEEVVLQVPTILQKQTLEGWSAFPSDHATLFFGLAAGIFAVHRLLGVLAFLHALLVISFPRMYLLFHHPTDIIVGALLGMTFVWVGNLSRIREGVVKPSLDWLLRRPAYYYCMLFFVTYEIAELFDGVRDLGKFVYGMMKGLLQGGGS